MRRILPSILIISMVLVLAAGCGGGAEETPSAGQPAAAQATQAPAAAQSAAQPAPTATEPAPAAEEELALTLEDRQSGLEQLDSYRVRWQGEWKATENGVETGTKWDWYQDYTADPKALYIKLNSSDLAEPANATSMQIWRIGNMGYILSAEGSEAPQCSAFSSDDQSSIEESMFNPGGMGRVEGAKYVGRETVNGVRTRHYTYDEKTAVLMGATKVSGEIWVAQDGSYVMKESVKWEGSANPFGATAQTEGQGTWTWEILEINPKLTIAPPEGCESPVTGLPIPPDASEKSQFGDMLSFKTASSMADTAKFYQDEMAKAGWTAEGEPELSDQFGMLNFTKEGQKSQIMLSPDGDQISVVISVTK